MPLCCLTKFRDLALVLPILALQGEKATDPAKATQVQGPEAAKAQDPKPDAPPQPTQELDMDELLAPYLTEGLLGRIEVATRIARMTEDELANRALPLLTGERNRLILEVKNLIESLGDVRYRVREQAETALVNMGPQVLPIVESLQNQADFEIRIRLERVLEKLKKAGTDDIVRKALIARGLAEALEYRSGDVEARALLSALDSLDSRVRLAAIRSLGTMLADAELAKSHVGKLFERILPDVGGHDLEMRNAAAAALGGSPTAQASDFLKTVVSDRSRSVSLRLLALRLLARGQDPGGLGQLRSALEEDDRMMRDAITFFASRKEDADTAPAPRVLLTLKDGGRLAETTIRATSGDEILFEPSAEFAGIEALRIPRAAVDEVRLSSAAAELAAEGLLVLLKTGTRLALQNARLDGDSLQGQALGREISLPRELLRGILPDPKRGRALGGSRRQDQLRLLEGEPKLIEGKVTGLQAGGVTIESGGEARTVPWSSVEVLLFQLDAGRGASGDAGDINQYVQADLRSGERVVGFLLTLGPRSIGLASESLGCFSLPLEKVRSLQLSNSGRALTGFTLVTDYGNTRVVEYDGEGRAVWRLEDLFDPLDAELTPSGTILVTEQGDNAVREYDREGNVTWEFTQLSRPLDADRLPNGNTLITDPGNFRVIEIDPEGTIVWTFGRKEAKNAQFKPYDADRLPNGNTLIADYAGERVIEVTPAGKVVWTYRGTKYVCDADRLANGNTLITMRQPPQVLEVTPAHAIVWRLKDVQLPWDADRLPDGTTMVAENFGVKVYNKEGKAIRTLEAEWASEANAY